MGDLILSAKWMGRGWGRIGGERGREGEGSGIGKKIKKDCLKIIKEKINKISKNTNEGYFFYTCYDKMSDRDYLRKEGRREGRKEGRKTHGYRKLLFAFPAITE